MGLGNPFGVRMNHSAESRNLNQLKRPTFGNEVTPQELSMEALACCHSNRLTAHGLRGEGLCKKPMPLGKPADMPTYTLLPRRRFKVGGQHDGVCYSDI